MDYLGCPLYSGRTTKLLFYPLLNKIQEKLSGWKEKLLSLGAKIVLIKHVLQAMPLYLLALIQPPKIIINVINKVISNFFWQDNFGQHKAHWVNWSKVCFPQEEGDLGLMCLQDISNAYVIKVIVEI